ncbi:MAG: HAD family phosphatase [Clostridia bacterium]|nr:HAD family phosphatase [Clostridia bacterium]
MKYDLFVSDFDGTLVRKDGTVSEENRRAIEAFRKKGGVFAVCSGRMLPSILPRVRELGLGGIVGAIQGAILAEIDTGKIIRCNAFSHLCALRAVTAAERRGLHTHIYTEDQFYSNMDDVFLEFYEKICGVRAERPREPLSSLLSGLKPIVKVIVMLEKEKRDGVYRELKEELGEEFYVTCSSDWMVEILPAGQNKGTAVEYLCRHYGIPLEKSAAIGDALNDYEMLERAGGKFAVENAEERLKEIAVTVPSCEEHGVAAAIRKYAMEEEL